MKRLTLLTVLAACVVAALFTGCGNTDDLAGAQLSSQSEALTEQQMVLRAFSTLHRVSPTRWSMVVYDSTVQLDQTGNTFKVSVAGKALFEVTSAAIAADLAGFEQQDPPPETSASIFGWLGKLIKAIGKLLSGGGGIDPTGAAGCGRTAELTCGTGCVQSVSSTVISCKFTCKSGGSCGGPRL